MADDGESERLRLNAGRLEWREIDEEVVILDLESSTYLVVNHSGALAWNALASGSTQGDLVERLVGRYGIERDAAEREIDTFLRDLDERGFLVREPT